MIDDQMRSEIVSDSPESLFFNKKFAVIVGLETHLAVWNICQDLISLGIMPVILVDGVCSTRDLDRPDVKYSSENCYLHPTEN